MGVRYSVCVLLFMTVFGSWSGYGQENPDGKEMYGRYMESRKRRAEVMADVERIPLCPHRTILRKVKTISEELNGEGEYMFDPYSFDVDEQGNLYVFDYSLWAILKFDPDFQYTGRFGRSGRGPGELSGMDGALDYSLQVGGKNSDIHIFDAPAELVHVFNSRGELLRDVSIQRGKYAFLYPSSCRTISPFGRTIMDDKGNLFFFEMSRKDPNTMVVRNQDGEVIFDFSLVPQTLSTLYVHNVPWFCTASTVWGLRLKSGRWVVCFPWSSTFYFFGGGGELLGWKRIIPRECAEAYRKDVAKTDELFKNFKYKSAHHGTTMFSAMFSDPVTDHFYLFFNCNGFMKDCWGIILKLNSRGEQVHAYLQMDGGARRFGARSGESFIALNINKECIDIFKEVK